MITRKDLVKVLDYVEFSGIFISKTTHWLLVNEESYQPVLINGTVYYASRLARLLITGSTCVYRDKAGAKWLASVGHKWGPKHLGRFFSDSDVAAVIREAAEKSNDIALTVEGSTRPL